MLNRVIIVALIVGFASGCGYQYEATVKCEFCNNVILKNTGIGCTEEEATAAATRACEAEHGQVTTPASVTSIFGVNTCGLRESAAEPLATADLVRVVRQTLGYPAESPSSPAVTCPPRKITFTVVAHNEWEEEGLPCQSVREVRVVYEKYISTGETESVTLSANVALGASHTFTCTDSATHEEDGTARYFYVAFQRFETVNRMCTPIPFSQGSMSRGFDRALRQGGNLDITVEDPGNLVHTITNATTATQSIAAVNSASELQPIPNPMFTPARR